MAPRIRKSASSRAGLIFPVARVTRKLKNIPQKVARVSKGAGVYLTSVMEYLLAEVLELSGNACRDNKRSRIAPRDILLAVGLDQELNRFFKDIIIPGGGVLANINQALINPNASHAAAVSPAPKNPKSPRARPQKVFAVPKVPKVGVLEKKLSGAVKKTSKNVTTLNERMLASGQKITVVQADITNVAVDTIVHPTSNSIHYGGQVGSAISQAGGEQLRKATAELSRTHGNLPKCGVAIGDTSNTPLLCKNIIHVNSPQWNQGSTSGCVEDLTQSVNNIFTLCETHGIKTVALPSISSGGNGFPKQLAAQTILRAINAYFKGLVAKKVVSSIEHVFFVLYDLESVGVYTSELGKLDI